MPAQLCATAEPTVLREGSVGRYETRERTRRPAMAISETPTSSLSLRLPVGVRATLSGFMAFNEGRETTPAHCAEWTESRHARATLIVAKHESRNRAKAAPGIEVATDWPSRAPAPVARVVRVRSLWSLTPGGAVDLGSPLRADPAPRSARRGLCRSCDGAPRGPAGSPPAGKCGARR